MNAPEHLPANGLAIVAERPNAQLRAPLIVGTQVTAYPRDMLALAPETVVLWPWPGQYRTNVFATTAGEIADAIRGISR